MHELHDPSNRIYNHINFMIVDKTDHMWIHSPVQTLAVPMYLHHFGNEVTPSKGQAILLDPENRKDFVLFVVDIIQEGHPTNPFPCPLIMATRETPT